MTFLSLLGQLGIDDGTEQFTPGIPDVALSIEGVHGSEFDDVIGGDAQANTLHGNGGCDKLLGQGEPTSSPGGERPPGAGRSASPAGL